METVMCDMNEQEVKEELDKLKRSHNLTDDILSLKCSDDHALDLADIISKWRLVGPRLKGIRGKDISDIDKDVKGGEKLKTRGLIELWRQRNGDDATYGDVVRALLLEKCVEDATNVCKLISPQNGSTAVTVAPALSGGVRSPAGNLPREIEGSHGFHSPANGLTPLSYSEPDAAANPQSLAPAHDTLILDPEYKITLAQQQLINPLVQGPHSALRVVEMKEQRIRELETELVQAKDRELAVAQQQLREKLTVRTINEAPCKMVRGSATTDQRVVYFTSYDSKLLYRYKCTTKIWEQQPPCKFYNSALVIIKGELTTVGGEEEQSSYSTLFEHFKSFFLPGVKSFYTRKLFTLQGGKWGEKYPEMNTERSSPTVIGVSDDESDYVIVIGGWRQGVNWTTTIKLLHVQTKKWSELKTLLLPLLRPSATICDDQVYVIGDGYTGYSCSLSALLSSDRIRSGSTLLWKRLPRLPVEQSTVASLSEKLVIVGGKRADGSPVNAIHQLVEGRWEVIGSMANRRSWCLSVSPSPERLLIVGGVADNVEEVTTRLL